MRKLLLSAKKKAEKMPEEEGSFRLEAILVVKIARQNKVSKWRYRTKLLITQLMFLIKKTT